jgi:hypothetical protein
MRFWCRCGDRCETDDLSSGLGGNRSSFCSDSGGKGNRVGMLVLFTLRFDWLDILDLLGLRLRRLRRRKWQRQRRRGYWSDL